MKKFIFGGLAAGAVALGLTVAGPAHADPIGYDGIPAHPHQMNIVSRDWKTP